jgi:hypothetical protein
MMNMPNKMNVYGALSSAATAAAKRAEELLKDDPGASVSANEARSRSAVELIDAAARALASMKDFA